MALKNTPWNGWIPAFAGMTKDVGMKKGVDVILPHRVVGLSCLSRVARVQCAVKFYPSDF
jgi:hypothetical protein